MVAEITPHEFFKALAIAGSTGTVTAPLKRAAAGSDEHSTIIDAHGGFMLPQKMADRVHLAAVASGEIVKRAQHDDYPLEGFTFDLPTTDPSDRTTAANRGVEFHWKNETVEATTSRPKLILNKAEKQTVIALIPVSNELLRSPLLGDFLENAIANALTYRMEHDALNGAAGGIEGIVRQDANNAGATIIVEKEGGQTANTILVENCQAMYARLPAQSRRDACWFVSESADSYLALEEVSAIFNDAISYAIGPDGKVVKLLFGLPLIPTEYQPVLGTIGDIVLADFREYRFVRETPRGVWSAEARFVNHESMFRVAFALHGQALWHKPQAPRFGTTTVSPFVVLEARA